MASFCFLLRQREASYIHREISKKTCELRTSVYLLSEVFYVRKSLCVWPHGIKAVNLITIPANNLLELSTGFWSMAASFPELSKIRTRTGTWLVKTGLVPVYLVGVFRSKLFTGHSTFYVDSSRLGLRRPIIVHLARRFSCI